MAVVKSLKNCEFCKARETVEVEFEQTKTARSVKVSICSYCKKQNLILNAIEKG